MEKRVGNAWKRYIKIKKAENELEISRLPRELFSRITHRKMGCRVNFFRVKSRCFGAFSIVFFQFWWCKMRKNRACRVNFFRVFQLVNTLFLKNNFNFFNWRSPILSIFFRKNRACRVNFFRIFSGFFNWRRDQIPWKKFSSAIEESRFWPIFWTNFWWKYAAFSWKIDDKIALFS